MIVHQTTFMQSTAIITVTLYIIIIVTITEIDLKFDQICCAYVTYVVISWLETNNK